MPHLAPLSWPLLFLLSWLILIIIGISMWWHQLPSFPPPSAKTHKQPPFTPWNWS